ncbi:MAG: hypothetical protein L3J39_03930 [Verrucomicrobiales bacterium]|nr:hypothetical protein [Verrucomicrobiales bacterium]
MTDSSIIILLGEKIMRYLLNVVVVCMLTFVAHAEEESVIPKGIRYKKAPAEVNKKAEQVIKRAFSLKATDQNILSLFESKTLICGPSLWHELKKDKVLSKLDKGKVVIQTPVLDNNGNISRMEKREGKLFQSPDEVLAFWKALSLRTDFTELKIRKLNPKELRIFWTMIPFDITEPLFILESKKHKILTVFTSPDKLKIMWIDDYQNISFTKNKSPNKSDAGDGK